MPPTNTPPAIPAPPTTCKAPVLVEYVLDALVAFNNPALNVVPS